MSIHSTKGSLPTLGERGVDYGAMQYCRFGGGYFDSDGQPNYYINDFQGNVAMVLDRHGDITQETHYYPYGAGVLLDLG